MRTFAQAVAAAAVAFSLSGTGHAQLLECRGAQKAQHVAELIFGRSIARGVEVTDDQWVVFVDREITPRFPDGLTVIEARGQWRDPARRTIVHEPSKRVEIVLPGRTDDQDRLAAIAQAYKSRFHQQSVAIVVRPACVSF
jgi:hypothetical protein